MYDRPVEGSLCRETNGEGLLVRSLGSVHWEDRLEYQDRWIQVSVTRFRIGHSPFEVRVDG